MVCGTSSHIKMNKALAFLSSPTLWAIVVLFLVNGIPPIRALLPVGILPFVDAFLAILTAYLHVGSVDKAYKASVANSVMGNRSY